LKILAGSWRDLCQNRQKFAKNFKNSKNFQEKWQKVGKSGKKWVK
jgi:hypothetical protein